MKPLQLSFPPSTNNLFATVKRRRVISERYRAWKHTAGSELLIQRPEKLSGPFALTMVATRPDGRARDLDNICKPVLDLLVAHGVVRDDSDCMSLRISWSAAEPDPKAGVQVVVDPA